MTGYRKSFASALALLVIAGCSAAPPSLPATPQPTVTVIAQPPVSASAKATSFKEIIADQYNRSVKVYRGWWSGYTKPKLHLLDTDSEAGAISDCGAPLEPGSAFYCPTDNEVYLDVGWFQDELARPRGDTGSLVVVAHELGHAWDHQKGIQFPPAPTVMQSELHADCLAGAVMADLGLDRSEIAAAASSIYSLGDFSWNDPGHHGTPAQRGDATRVGASQGREGCNPYIA